MAVKIISIIYGIYAIVTYSGLVFFSVKKY